MQYGGTERRAADAGSFEMDETARRRVAIAVRDRRSELGLSQEDVAARSGGMISTANVRVVERQGRSRYRARSLIGLARALAWPDDAIDQLIAGVPARELASVGTAPAIAPVTVAEVELVTRTELDDLRRIVAELARQLTELRAAAAPGPADRASTD